MMAWLNAVLNLVCGKPDNITENSATVARRQLLALTKDAKPPHLTAPVERKCSEPEGPCPLCERR